MVLLFFQLVQLILLRLLDMVETLVSTSQPLLLVVGIRISTTRFTVALEEEEVAEAAVTRLAMDGEAVSKVTREGQEETLISTSMEGRLWLFQAAVAAVLVVAVVEVVISQMADPATTLVLAVIAMVAPAMEVQDRVLLMEVAVIQRQSDRILGW